MAPQPVEVIDLTLGDDDDDDAPAAPSHASINNGRQGSQARPHSSHAHPHAPGSAPRDSDERPAKRPKLDDAGLRPAYSAVSPIACAGAKQAVHEDPRLIESVLQRKVSSHLLWANVNTTSFDKNALQAPRCPLLPIWRPYHAGAGATWRHTEYLVAGDLGR